VVLSLIRLPEAPSASKPRLDAIQQSRDFLEFVQGKAARQGVAISRLELYTRHPVLSIRTLAQEMDCSGILLFVHRGDGVLLATTEVKQLLEDHSLPLYIARLHTDESRFPGLRWLFRLLGR
jgi:GAF domain-containing protein